MDMDTETYVKIPVTDVKNPIAIAYDPVEERIYWTDVLLKQIRSSTIEGEDEILVKQLNQSEYTFKSLNISNNWVKILNPYPAE